MPLAPIDFRNLSTATPSPPIEPFVRNVEVRIIWPQIFLNRRSPPKQNHSIVCFEGVAAQRGSFAMRTNCVTTPEATSPARAGGLVRTHETVAMFEVGVPVSLDLPEVRMPVATVSDPAEYGLLPVEVGDRPKLQPLSLLLPVSSTPPHPWPSSTGTRLTP